jgi:ABC-2 type transport system permease protein
MTDRVPHPLVELTRARVREFLREPEVIFWVFAFPILMALALGLAFRSRGPAPVPVAVEEGSGAAETAEALRRSPELDVRILGGAALERAARNGDVHVVVVPGRPPTYRYDPTRAESRLARVLVDAALQSADGRADRFRANNEEVVAPGSRYIDWVLPGLLGMNIMGTGMWGVGFSIVQARMRKLLKRLVATPMRRWHYLLSHILSRLVFLVLEIVALLGFGWLVFGVPVRGSFVLLGAVALAGAMAFSGLGLLVASRPRTIEAVSGLMNVVMLPMWILSGTFFSSGHFPAPMQPFIQALPLTALNDALRAVMIEGAAAPAVAGEVAILAAWTGLSFAVALRIFRWR